MHFAYRWRQHHFAANVAIGVAQAHGDVRYGARRYGAAAQIGDDGDAPAIGGDIGADIVERKGGALFIANRLRRDELRRRQSARDLVIARRLLGRRTALAQAAQQLTLAQSVRRHVV